MRRLPPPAGGRLRRLQTPPRDGPASPSSVQADFDDTRFDSPKQTARFTASWNASSCAPTAPTARPADLPVSHASASTRCSNTSSPAGGRLQALGVAWDTVRRRWFSPARRRPAASRLAAPLTGRYQNWNLMCGECHTTAFRKGYDDARDTYRTAGPPATGCQALPRPRRGPCQQRPHGRNDARPHPNRLPAAPTTRDQCASCHARRTWLVEDAAPGTPFLDNYLPDNLRPGLYFADGQQKDEKSSNTAADRQSCMYQAGVACTDCHEPHGGKLRARGNGLCLQCHNSAANPRFAGLKAKDYDSPAHHFTPPGQPGSQCVDATCRAATTWCHGRRDHASASRSPR